MKGLFLDAVDDLAAVFQTDRSGERLQPVNVVGSAIQRIDNPAEVAPALSGWSAETRVLFAQPVMIGIGGQN